MAVAIRLQRMGTTNRAFFRIVAADSRTPRSGKVLENLGHYDPMKKEDNVVLDAERAKYWVSVGAQISDGAKALLRKQGVFSAVEKKSKKAAK